MGFADRDYQRRETRGGGMFASLPPVVKWLLIANAAIFALDYLVLPMLLGDVGRGLPPILRWGAYAIRSAIFEGRVWEFITFQFLHASVGHLLFNCLGLFFFGPFMERWLGARRFLVFYLICGAAGAVLYTLLVFAGVVADSALVGASAGIYGILAGVAVIAPDLRVRLLFPPIELSMRQLAIALLVIAVGAIVFQLGGNEGGEAGHLGGAIAGFLLMKFPRLLGRTGGARRTVNAAEPKLRPRVTIRRDDEVDRILDKISSGGFQSLSEDEKEVLRRASQRDPNDP